VTIVEQAKTKCPKAMGSSITKTYGDYRKTVDNCSKLIAVALALLGVKVLAQLLQAAIKSLEKLVIVEIKNTKLKLLQAASLLIL
jgi:hypothetical protein